MSTSSLEVPGSGRSRRGGAYDARVLVAGCGAMGLPMAETLLRAGFDVHGFDVAPGAAYLASALPRVDHPHDARADTLVVVVRDHAQIDALCFDEQALFAPERVPHEAVPRTVILCSTVAVATVTRLRERLPPEVALVDAPMSGAPVAAHEAALSFMLGGDEAAIDASMPLFEAMGTRTFRLGALGRGMRVKLLNNTVAAASVCAVRRALADAARSGIADETLLAVMTASSGATWFGERYADIAWARQGHAPDNTIGILEKDLRCALESAERAPDAFDEALLAALRALPAVR